MGGGKAGIKLDEGWCALQLVGERGGDNREYQILRISRPSPEIKIIY